jgi:signal transduction histidine kinase/ligand-binding sensor domain-containing protein
MWFGTDGGLVKYDGRRIQKIAPQGPASDRVLALKSDDAGVLWMGTAAGAARLINGGVEPISETRFSAVKAIITPEAGRALMTSDQGEIFDCTTAPDGSLAVRKIAPDQHPLLRIGSRDDAPLPLTSLALTGKDLIVGTRGRGLIAIDATQIKSGEPMISPSIKEILSRPRAFFVEAIETDPRGRLWFGAETGPEGGGFYDGGDLMRPERIGAGTGTGTVTALQFDPVGNTWIGTDSRGAFCFRDSRKVVQFTFENTSGGLLSNHIYSIFVDREGVVWFATDRGVCRYDPQGIRVESISADADSNFSRALFQASDGTVWCGTNRGLFARTRDSTWQEVLDLKRKVIHSIGEEPPGRLLVGTAAGLFVAVKPSSTRMPAARGRRFAHVENVNGASDNIRAISIYRGSVYLANFGRGIERLDGTTRTLVWPDVSADARQREVLSLHADNELLYIGTAEAGVFLFDGKQATIDHALDELAGGVVWSIEGARDDVLWLASGRGLFALHSGKLLSVIEGVDARCVVKASGGGANRAAWCATVGGGVLKALLETGNSAVSFLTTKIDSEQGLPSQNAFSVAPVREASGGEVIWIGTSHGVARYEPGRAPFLNLTRVMGKRVYDKEEVLNGLNLEYPQNSLSVDVAAISSRTFSEQFQYSFTVLDAEGRVVSQKCSRESQLLIEGLRPGGYRVAVRAYANDLIPSDPLQFGFAVARTPFPWTSTALAALLALAILAIWWGYRQNRSLVRTNLQLAGARMQLANETESERRRIARDLHDQTLADLRRLMMLTDRLPAGESMNGHVKPSDFRSQIESISTEIRRICEDLSPSALANVGLAAALEWALADAVANHSSQRRFEYEFVCDGKIDERLRLEPATQIQIYRIVQEVLSNVCRHSAATRVRLSVMAESNSDLVIELEDNGCGFDAGRHGKAGRGLTNIRARASMIEASVNWNTSSDGGTLFTLRRSVAGFVGRPSDQSS